MPHSPPNAVAAVRRNIIMKKVYENPTLIYREFVGSYGIAGLLDESDTGFDNEAELDWN